MIDQRTAIALQASKGLLDLPSPRLDREALLVLAPDQLAVDLWQVSQLPVTVAWIGFDGLPTALRYEPVWQVKHPAEAL